ncbi:MAG: hypothetical protein HFG52_12625 [Lachnospiraceae bacterium]|nr:hypothetical protein [Lachnospiraceae bacterium]
MNHIVNVQMRPVAYGERSERNAGGLHRQKLPRVEAFCGNHKGTPARSGP